MGRWRGGGTTPPPVSVNTYPKWHGIAAVGKAAESPIAQLVRALH